MEEDPKKKEEEVKKVKTEKEAKPEKEEKDYSLFKKVEGKPKEREMSMKTMETIEERVSKRKKIKKISIISAIIIFILAIFSTVFSLTTMTSEKIIKGVSISGLNVSGLTKEQAQEKLEEIYNKKKENDINLKYQDYEATLNPTIMEVDYNIKKAVEDAFAVGRGGNIFVSNYKVLYTLVKNKNIDIDLSINEEVAKQKIEDIGINLPGIVEESSYYVEDSELIIRKGKPGIVIDGTNLYEKVKENLQSSRDLETMEIPVIEKDPEPIDIEKIHNEICVEAKDAYYTENPLEVYPEVEGISFDIEEAKAILATDQEEYIIKLTVTKPKVTLSQLGNVAFPSKLGTFQTRYDVTDTDRTANLIIACQKLNGKIVLPGETFSYNKTLGPRTSAAGYKNGKIYSGGEVVDGIGGGICQISSTLYNAVLLSNLGIVERRNHQFVTSYVEAGRDATVVYGAIDFKFKNTRKYPIKIQASASAGIATVSIYGIKEEEYTFSFSTKVITTIPMQTKYEDDGSLPSGTEQVKQKGANGKITETYITKYLNGKVIETKLLSRDKYDAMAKIIVRGTGKASTTPPATTSEPTTPQATPSVPSPSPEPSIAPEQSPQPDVSTQTQTTQ